MRFEETIAWLALGACFGCSNVLGLDDLSFDRNPAEEDPRTGLRSDQDSGSYENVDSGGIVVLGPSYPTLWRESQMLMADGRAQKDDTFVVYDKQSGALEEHRAWDNGFEVTRTWQWKPGFTFVVQLPTSAGGVAWIGYHSTSGLAEYVDAIPIGESVVAEVIAGNAGWTHMIAIPVDESSYLLSYNRDNGHYRLGTLPGTADAGAVQWGEWRSGWTSIVSYPLESSGGVFKYDAATGEAELDRVSEDGQGTVNVHRATFGTGWTTITSFRSGAETRLLLYNGSAGSVATAVLDLSFGMTLQFVDEELWREQITAIEPIEIESSAFAITHSSGTTVADVVSLNPLESSNPVILR